MLLTGLGRFEPFRSEAGDPDISIHYHIADGLRGSGAAPGSLSLLLSRFPVVPGHIRPRGTECRLFHHPPFIQRLKDCLGHAEHVVLDVTEHSAVIHDFRSRRADVFRTRESAFSDSEGRIVLSSFTVSGFLHGFNALLIHSACVDYEGRSAVLLATDGGGKTTAASLCSDGKVLSDDQVLFRKRDDGGWMACGTPWTTFPPDPAISVPGAFFLLEKADEFSLRRLGPLQLLSYLWDEHAGARLLVPRNRQTALLDLYRDLSAWAPVYLLRFSREHIDQEHLLKCLKT